MAGIETKVKVNGSWKSVVEVKAKVGGSWKLVTTIYRKISGSWKEIYSAAKELSYYGTAPSLSDIRHSQSVAKVGNYVMFGGGYSGNKGDIDTYNKSLVKSSNIMTDEWKERVGAASSAYHAIFAGGKNYNGSRGSVDCFSSSLARTTGTVLYNSAIEPMGASINGYALIAGGDPDYSTVNAYSSTLVRTNPTALTVIGFEGATISTSTHAIFAGGAIYDTYHDKIDMYSSSLVKSSGTVLSVARKNLRAATVGNYIIFAGGYNSSNNESNVVDIYTLYMVRQTPTTLPLAVNYPAAMSFPGGAVIAGGFKAGAKTNTTVFNASLVKDNSFALPTAIERGTGTVHGNYGLIAGGVNLRGDAVNTVYAFEYK